MSTTNQDETTHTPDYTANPTRGITLIPLHDIIDHPENPKDHRPDLIANSLNRLGTIDLVTRDDRTGYTISGHGRTKALRTLHADGAPPPEGVTVTEDGTWLVPVITGWSSRDDDHARAALVTLNTLTEAGGWIDEDYLPVLQSLADADAELLALTGKTMDDLAALDHILNPDYTPVSAHERRLDVLDEKPCPKCGYDTANDPDNLRTPR